MKIIVRAVLGIALMTALVIGLSGTAPLATPAAAVTYVSSTYTAPKKGQTSAGVTALQRRLVKADVLQRSYITGYFGPLTEQAVKRFQRRHGLTASGRVTPTTWRVLVRKTGRIVISGSTSRGRSDRRCTVAGRVLCIDKTRD